MAYSIKTVRKLIESESDIEWIGEVEEHHFLYAKEKLKATLTTQENIGGLSREILLHITSGGGDMDVAWAFRDLIRIMRVRLVTLASGNVESAAMLIYLAGRERYASRDSAFLIHDPTIILPEDTRLSARDSARIDKQVLSVHMRYLRALSRETGLSIKELDKISEEALLITPKQAKELGIVHHII